MLENVVLVRYTEDTPTRVPALIVCNTPVPAKVRNILTELRRLIRRHALV